MSKRGFPQQHFGSLSSDDSEEETQSYAGFGMKKRRLESTDNEERGEEEEEEEEEEEDDDDDDDSESDENDWNNANVTKSQTSTTSSAPTNSNYSAFAQRIMKNMGYEEGKGLGKYGQGLVAPVQASTQRGRRGLGLRIEGLEAQDNQEWDSSEEYVEVNEEVQWLPHCPEDVPDLDTLESWSREGKEKLTITDETEFCSPEVLEGILRAKTIFDQLDARELQRSRSRSNPFETLGKLFFQNRAALKMANMDAVFDFMFTRPVDETGESLVGSDEVLYFADVCAAPGGFSEYVLWRRKTDSENFCDAKGFGFTLRENDFKLHDFFAAPAEFFEPHYGINGRDGDGDVFQPTNITNFVNFVRKSSGGQGVHFMMADGGFSVEGQENIQEILSKQLYLCQFLVALGIVRTDGHFVCKLFDIFTTFSAGLIYLMYRCFKYVSIHKPNTSRPANSERYIICKWKREGIEDVYEYLFEMNQRIAGLKSTGIDVMELVPLEHLKNDEAFTEYMINSNNTIGFRQIVSLRKIQVYCQDTQLIEPRQAELRSQCLESWQLPDRTRTAPQRSEAKVKFMELLKGENPDYMCHPPEELSLGNFKEKLRSPYDYRCVILASPRDGRKDRAFYLGLGGSNVFRWEGRAVSSWMRVDTKLELPPNTLVYAELVVEHRGEHKAQRKLTTFHLIDGIVLNGKDIRNLHIVERHNYLRKFALGLNKPSRPDLAPIRCKQLYKLEDLGDVLAPPRLHHRLMKGGSLPRRVYLEVEGDSDRESYYTIPTALLLVKSTKEPWMMAFSKSQNKKYWFNTMTRHSTFECQQEFIAPFSSSYSGSLIWWWDSNVQVLSDDESAKGKLHRDNLLSHLISLR